MENGKFIRWPEDQVVPPLRAFRRFNRAGQTAAALAQEVRLQTAREFVIVPVIFPDEPEPISPVELRVAPQQSDCNLERTE